MIGKLVGSAGFLSSGGTIGGDLTISGDLTVSGSSAITTNEVIQGTSIIDITNATAFTVRKDSSGGDVFVVNTDTVGATLKGVLTVGVDNTGHDVKLFGATASAYFLWDESEDGVVIANENKWALKAKDISTAAEIGFKTTNSAGIVGTASNHGMEFYTNDARVGTWTTGGNLGIGNSAPGALLEVSVSDENPTIELSSWSTTDAHKPYLIFQKSASATINTLAATAAGEDLGRIVAKGVNTSSAADESSAILFEGDAAPDGDAVPGRMSFWTSDAATLQQRMTIDDAGNVGLGTDAPADEFHLKSGSEEGAITVEAQSIALFQRSVNSGYHCYITIASGSAANAGIHFGDNGDANIGQIIYDNNDNELQFVTNTAQQMVITSAGDIQVSTGNLVIGTAGKGIDFSNQASPAAGMTSELLDRYEEGTWTPTHGTFTFDNTAGNYTRIGNLVTFSARVTINNIATSDAVWGGLPFTEGKGNLECGGNATWVGVDINTGTTLYPRISNGATTFSFYAAVDNGSWNNTLTTAADDQIAFFGFYYAAS
jgi:hypothetical protein